MSWDEDLGTTPTPSMYQCSCGHTWTQIGIATDCPKCREIIRRQGVREEFERMNNTEIIDLFRANLSDDVKLLPLQPGPPVLGGRFQQHLRNKFRVYGDFKYEPFAQKAIIVLAQSVCRLPGGYRFFQLDDPKTDCDWRVIEDPEISIRECSRMLPERWTEPAEDLSPEEVEAFEPRLRWPVCREYSFEVILTCGQ